MTFDEAIEKIESITDELNIRQDIINDIVNVVECLHDEYAPTVEMTNYQKGLLLRYLDDLPFSDLISDVYLSRAGGAGDEHGDRYDDLSDEDIMNAWLHPETIKVVDE